MNSNEEKRNILKKIKDIDIKIDNEKTNIKQNSYIIDELNKINDSYNRCLDILSQSATGKTINQKYNDLYSENRINHIEKINNLEQQLYQSKKNIDSYIEEKDILKENYKEDKDNN